MLEAIPLFLIVSLFFSCAASSNARSSPAEQAPSLTQAQSPKNGGKEKPYVEGRILVKFQEDATPEDIDAVKRELHLEIVRSLSSPNLYLMRICDNTPVETVLERLKAYSKVKYAEPDVLYKID